MPDGLGLVGTRVPMLSLLAILDFLYTCAMFREILDSDPLVALREQRNGGL